MKVSNNSLSNSLKGIENQSTRGIEKSSSKSAEKASVSADDIKGSSKVNLSESAQRMQKAKDIATSTDTVDEAKVARLQKLIDDGNYKVDSAAVADRMVDEHLLFSE